MGEHAILATGVFSVIYGIIIIEKIHRTIIAMIGGILMVVLGIVNQETAIHHIDFNTLGLLMGMMLSYLLLHKQDYLNILQSGLQKEWMESLFEYWLPLVLLRQLPQHFWVTSPPSS